MSSTVTASDWIKGIALSVLASIIGASSKLAIRKSWLLLQQSSSPSPPLVENQLARQATAQRDDRVVAETSGTQSIPTTVTSANDEEGNIADDGQDGYSYQMMTGRANSFAEDSSTEQFADERQPDALSQQLQQPQLPQAHPPTDRGVRMTAWCLRGAGLVGMTFLNPAACVWAMNYASPSILAPFSGLTLVWIVFFSQPLIGESPTVRQVIAACLIIAGQVCVAVFGDHTNQENMSVAKMTQSYKELPFLIYVCGTVAWVALLVGWIHYSQSPILRRFAWGCAGGSITGFQNFLKDFLTVLQVKAPNEPYPWYTLPFAILAILTAFWGLLFLTWCMKKYDVTYSAAAFVGSFVINASIMSAVHYHTFLNLSSIVDYVLYPFGLLVLLCGVGVLVMDHSALEASTDDVPTNRNILERESVLTSRRSSMSRVGSRVEMQEPLVGNPTDIDAGAAAAC